MTELTEKAFIQSLADVWNGSPPVNAGAYLAEGRDGRMYHVYADGTIMRLVIDTFNSGLNRGQS